MKILDTPTCCAGDHLNLVGGLFLYYGSSENTHQAFTKLVLSSRGRLSYIHSTCCLLSVVVDVTINFASSIKVKAYVKHITYFGVQVTTHPRLSWVIKQVVLSADE